MLEQIVQKTRGLVLFFVVFALSAVFVLQFGGPQAEGCGGSQAGAAAEVYGQSISRNELKAAYFLAGGENFPAEMAKQYKLEDMVLYGLIERSLLAREARALGFDVSEREVLERVAEDGVIHLSMSVEAGPYLPPSGPLRFNFDDSDGKFSKENLKNFIQYRLRRSVREFGRSQIEETLAQRMRETAVAGVTIGKGELWDAYVREQESVKLAYLRFSKVYYGQKLEPSDADLTAFMQAKASDVDAEYEKQKHRYTGLEKQVRARHILVKTGHGASDEDKQAARERIEALLVRAQAGEDFATLAREHSEDVGSAKKGGDLGFNAKGRMVKPFDEAQFALEAGQISAVVESTFGFHVIKVEAIREGDVPVEEAKRELAEKLYRDTEAGRLAREAAAAALAKLQGGATMAQVQDGLLGRETTTDTEAGADGETEEPTAEAPIDPLAPQVRETQPFGRTDTPIPGPFDSSPLVEAGYALSEDKPLATEPMQLGDDFFVYRLLEKKLAEEENFNDAEQARIRQGLLRRRQQDELKAYVRTLLERAQEAGAVLVDETLVSSADKPSDSAAN
ncbi:MAG: peptidylprolyl isomerase [Myxococcales bacterium]|nr:peptidylprolyl isomerase [Myxococcales bacterium]